MRYIKSKKWSINNNYLIWVPNNSSKVTSRTFTDQTGLVGFLIIRPSELVSLKKKKVLKDKN